MPRRLPAVDGVLIGRYPDAGHGMVAGDDLEASRSAAIIAGAFEASGLSTDRWRFSFMAFYGIYDQTEAIRPTSDGWQPEIGSLRLPLQPTAVQAERLLDATPHVQIDILNGLEAVHLGRTPSRRVALYLRDGLYIEQRAGGRPSLTDKGMALMDSDPRTIPSALKDIVLSRVVALEEERLGREQKDAGSDGVSVPPIMSLRDARFQIGSHLAVDSSGGGALSFLNALRNGLELRADVASSEPHEEIVTASGIYADGRSACDLTVLLMAPSWVGDRSRLLAEAIVDVQDDLRAALRDTPRAVAFDANNL